MKTTRSIQPARDFIRSAAAVCTFILSTTISPAQTWLPAPPGSADSIWNNPLNWAPANVPDAAGETATFAVSNKLNPVIVAPITIDGITFTPAAPGYTITNNSSVTLVGAGVANGSAVGQTFTNNGAFSFSNAASAGTGTSVVFNNGAPLASMNFFDTSTAGTAVINVTNSTVLITFFDASTAGASTINNAGASGAFPGSTVSFFATASAGTANIINSGANTLAFFGANSTASTATIVNSGAGSGTVLVQDASAGGASIVNSGATSFLEFNDQSTAATAQIGNSGANARVTFFDTSTAATSTITNSGSGSRTEFNNQSSAADSTITLSGPLSSASFFDTSTAANSNITLTAANSVLSFFDNSTAGASTINNNGSGPFPSSIVGFFGSSTADVAVIGNNGANTQTLFSDNSTAGTSTITNRGAGSSTVFAAAASGGSARLINANPTAFIDISQLTTAGTTVGSVDGNGFLNLGSKRLTTGLDGRSTTFSGIIRDGGLGGGAGGSLVKVGSGTFTLTGANTFTGGTTLQSGTIVVAGPQALGAGDVRVSGGVLRAGGATRNINVGGNYTQTGGELALRIGGSSDGQYDRLAVAGRANLGGRLRVDSQNGFRPERGDSFTLVTAKRGVTGRFATFANNLPGDFALQLELIYEPNQVILGAVQGNFSPFAKTPNQKAVARALDSSLFDSGAFDLIDYLNTVPGRNIPGALDKIAPEEFGAIFEISRASARMQAFTVNHRLDEIHAATRDALSDQVGESNRTDDGHGKSVIDGKSAKTVKNEVSLAPPLRRLGMFANANGEFVQVGSTYNARGFDFESGGATVGVDYLFTDHFAAGLLFNYTRSRADLTGSGRLEADAVRAGIYASVFGSGLYLSTYVGGGVMEYDTRRDGLNGQTRGNTDGTEFNALVTGGYDAHIGRLTIGPVVSYQYTSSTYDGFDEKGSLAPLQVRSQRGESSRTNVGARATMDFQLGSVVFTPELRASWQHEFGDITHATDARFAFGGRDFTVQSAEVGRNSLVVGAGFSVRFSERCSAYAYYDGELGRSNYDSHNGIVGVRVSF